MAPEKIGDDSSALEKTGVDLPSTKDWNSWGELMSLLIDRESQYLQMAAIPLGRYKKNRRNKELLVFSYLVGISVGLRDVISMMEYKEVNTVEQRFLNTELNDGIGEWL